MIKQYKIDKIFFENNIKTVSTLLPLLDHNLSLYEELKKAWTVPMQGKLLNLCFSPFSPSHPLSLLPNTLSYRKETAKNWHVLNAYSFIVLPNGNNSQKTCLLRTTLCG